MTLVVRGRQPPGELHLSFDRKVSPAATYQASRNRWIPTIPNSFGLPSGDSCPGMTSFCAACYASGSEQSAGVRELVERNLRLLRDAGTVDAMFVLLDRMVGRYVDHADRAGVPPGQRMFRIHWDGDFFSTGYAAAWATVIARHPDIAFWCYTRSFAPPVDVVPTLAGIENLALYLSVDADNAAAAQAQTVAHPDVRVALCAVDYETARGLIPPRDQTPVVCPENAGRIGLSNSDGVGACVTCRLCPDDRRDILFSTSHVESVAIPVAAPVRVRTTPNGVALGTVCRNPACDTFVPRRPGRGRPRLYCDTCRPTRRRHEHS
jgi:hypothetical protein